MALADYCMEPGQNTVKLAAPDIDVFVQYYADCPAGQNPIGAVLSGAAVAIEGIRRSTQSLLRVACRGDRELKDAFQRMNSIQDSLDSINNRARCRPNQEAFAQATHDGFCGGVYKGIWVIWLAIFVCGAVLLLGLIFTACVYPYYTQRRAKDATTQPDYATAPLTEL
jgi:hypothetical protein